ncbi:MAG: galactokinase [Desulfatitalea sp.]|nr:galactokinase [Desulfatitalea sp.]NNK02720.1 galactokinase [Desulfatitalea sp.]
MTDWSEILEHNSVAVSAPCRVDLGGTLDLSTFYLPLRHLQPCTFNIALNMRTRVRLEGHTRGRLKITSSGFESFETDSLVAPFHPPMGLMTAVAAYFQGDGVHIHIESASPPRSSLGGSSAAAVALVWAFHKALAMQGDPPVQPAVAVRLAHAIEQSVAGVPCGLQDHLAAVFGGINAWHWPSTPDAPAFRRQVVLPAERCRSFSQNILVAYCGAPHESKDVNGTCVREFLAGRHRQQWQQVVACGHRFVHAMAREDLSEACRMMNQETQLRIQILPEVLDTMGYRLTAAAQDAGCGARFAGAGGGGCVWALGQPEKVTDLRPTWQAILDEHPEALLLTAEVDPTGIL